MKRYIVAMAVGFFVATALIGGVTYAFTTDGPIEAFSVFIQGMLEGLSRTLAAL